MTVWREKGTLSGSMLAADRAFVLRMLLRAFATAGVYLDIRCGAQAVSGSEERVIP